MSRILGILFALVLLTGGVVLGITLAGQLSNNGGDTTTVDKPALGSAPVVRTDLVERKAFDATLEFGDRRMLLGTLAGTVTDLPQGGDLVEAGDALLEIDGAPVVVMVGERPMWRPLAADVAAGADVAQLEDNLADLGHLVGDDGEPLAPDDTFDDDTAAAVEQWREERGLPEGNTIELGRVVFMAEPVRVGEVVAGIGDVVGPGVPLFEVSSTVQDVVLQLPVDDRDLARVGDTVVIVLPGDVETTGSIREISRVVTRVPGPVEPTDVIEVVVTLDDPSLAGALDRAPVDVELESDRAAGVLAVPVDALVALAEGGYAVQVIRDDERILVAVEIGTFLDTLVEVTGELAEGETVVVPR